MKTGMLVLAAMAALAGNAETGGQHTVFAHYMTCFGLSVDSYKREMMLAQQYGVDGWALNCGNWKKQDPKTGECVVKPL
jgi:hypothetical protein